MGDDLMRKYDASRRSSLEKPKPIFWTCPEKTCLGNYLLEKYTAAVSDEVEKICEEFARRRMLDEYLEGTLLDTFITHKYEIIRNKLRRQHLNMIESMEIRYRIESAEALR